MAQGGRFAKLLHEEKFPCCSILGHMLSVMPLEMGGPKKSFAILSDSLRKDVALSRNESKWQRKSRLIFWNSEQTFSGTRSRCFRTQLSLMPSAVACAKLIPSGGLQLRVRG